MSIPPIQQPWSVSINGGTLSKPELTVNRIYKKNRYALFLSPLSSNNVLIKLATTRNLFGPHKHKRSSHQRSKHKTHKTI